jgi:uncharacterized protein (UPF0332 family)
VKPQTAAFLAKSREFLDKAHDLFGAHHWPDEAGRAAYFAGLHAAQALIFETTGQLRKRHSTVQGEFARLVKDNPRVDMELPAFLPRTYNLKAIADYQTDRPRFPSDHRASAGGDQDGEAFCRCHNGPSCLGRDHAPTPNVELPSDGVYRGSPHRNPRIWSGRIACTIRSDHSTARSEIIRSCTQLKPLLRLGLGEEPS